MALVHTVLCSLYIGLVVLVYQRTIFSLYDNQCSHGGVRSLSSSSFLSSFSLEQCSIACQVVSLTLGLQHVCISEPRFVYDISLLYA